MSARLNTEIKNLDAEVAKNQEALDKATALRQKELAECAARGDAGQRAPRADTRWTHAGHFLFRAP